MALSDPRLVFGAHSISPYNRTSGAFYGTAKVIGSFALNLSGELIKLNGGSQRFPWAIEEGYISSEITFKVKQYEDWMFELFLGKAPTAAGVDASGAVSTPVEVKGTTIMDGSTGLASIIVIPTTGAANLKFGKYVVIATTDDDLDIFMSTDADFLRGTDESYDSDLLKVGTVAIGDSGATTDVASLGLRFTAGSGTTAFTVADSAMFEVLPPTTKSMSVVIGAASDSFPEFGCIVMAQKRGNGEFFEIDLYRCKGVGLPISFEEKAWSEAEVKVEAFYDSTKDGIFKVRSALVA